MLSARADCMEHGQPPQQHEPSLKMDSLYFQLHIWTQGCAAATLRLSELDQSKSAGSSP